MVTMLGDSFAQWVDQQVAARNAKVKDERDMEIEMDPDIIAIFQASTSVGGKCFADIPGDHSHRRCSLYPDHLLL